jgi:hypothetical protein
MKLLSNEKLLCSIKLTSHTICISSANRDERLGLNLPWHGPCNPEDLYLLALRVLVPGSQAKDEASIVDGFSSLAFIGSRSVVASAVGEANIGRKFPSDFITDADTAVEIGKA